MTLDWFLHTLLNKKSHIPSKYKEIVVVIVSKFRPSQSYNLRNCLGSYLSGDRKGQYRATRPT